jgi:hypothetical protein
VGTTDSWRATHARVQGIRETQARQALAHFSAQSSGTHRRDELLHRSDTHVRCALLACRVANYAELGQVSSPFPPFGAEFLALPTNCIRHNRAVLPILAANQAFGKPLQASAVSKVYFLGISTIYEKLLRLNAGPVAAFRNANRKSAEGFARVSNTGSISVSNISAAACPAFTCLQSVGGASLCFRLPVS